jgi:hypothetical protein
MPDALIGFNGGYAINKILFWDEPPGNLPWQVQQEIQLDWILK